jgi:lipoprotein-anchoring transpeptidase ErfK/SrfK
MGILPEFDLQQISRRGFLKLSGAAAVSILGPFSWIKKPLLVSNLQTPETLPSLGRVLDNNLTLYDRPSLKGKMLKMFWRDLVKPITQITVGDDNPVYNRVWYQINGEGFVHSGGVQPVEVRQNEVAGSIPIEGQLAEITVPFTDAIKDPTQNKKVAYRLYYGTTHWVTAIVQDETGAAWYKIWDDRFKTEYYANAAHLRLINADELKIISPNVPANAKRIEVHLDSQVVIAYENDQPVFMSRAATGAKFSDGNYSTPIGRFMTTHKRPSRHMAAGDLAAANSFDLPGVPWVCYLTEKGVSLHGTFWHNDFGKPRSHGCINLPSPAAKWIYLWTLPNLPADQLVMVKDEGTQVDVIL